MRQGAVYYRGISAGIITEDDQGYEFRYHEAYVAGPGSVAISFLLPLTSHPYTSAFLFPFFDGLIPEGWLLHLGTSNWKLDPKDRFGLLLKFCRDPIGAVSVRPLDHVNG